MFTKMIPKPTNQSDVLLKKERVRPSLSGSLKLHLFLLPVRQIVWSEYLTCHDNLFLQMLNSLFLLR
jgi:hypothetical protein